MSLHKAAKNISSIDRKYFYQATLLGRFNVAMKRMYFPE